MIVVNNEEAPIRMAGSDVGDLNIPSVSVFKSFGELLKLEVEVLGAADARVSGGAHVLVLNVSFRSAPTTACTRRRGYSRLIRMTSALPPCPAAPIICASIVAREVRLRLCE